MICISPVGFCFDTLEEEKIEVRKATILSQNHEDSIRKAISIVGALSESYYGVPENLKQEVKPYLKDYMYDLLKDRY